MLTKPIAIVGMACQYADARTPEELWENVLAQRRAFRRMPQVRLRVEDYLSADRNAPDAIYSAQAAVIEGYQFDRVRFRVAGSTFRSADLAHWLALDVASQALNDAGFTGGEGLPRETTGVFLGNTLTGEFSRSNLLRLRWPYVRRMAEGVLREQGWKTEDQRAFLERLETEYKKPFPAIDGDSLAGGLSNTIAGRICIHFSLNGGGYVVDGACASSLLAVANACTAIMTGDLDAALAGGVDLSMDPFELVGFSKVGALADEKMRVYDRRSAGFWPGEGCGFAVLMRYEDAIAQGRKIYAVIRGWGVSSDGSGGITRPEIEGQLLALRRAYRRADFGIETVAYFEGHGTGTSVGDATELRALSSARREAARDAPPAALGSIKANIGHTKAAAGIAGLIKATMALTNQVLPPTTGCEEPHQELIDETPALRVLEKGESWPADRHLRAGVSSMGFGGINAHIVLEGASTERRRALSPRESALLSSTQDAELLLLGAPSANELRKQVEHLLTFAARLSHSEVGDLAAQLAKKINGLPAVRAGVVASSPAQLEGRLEKLRSWIINQVEEKIDTKGGLFLKTSSDGEPCIGFLFPGQGSPTRLNGGAWRRRFKLVEELYAGTPDALCVDDVSTAVAQPAIARASLAALRVLASLGVKASIAVGHSLGELTALHWAGVIDEEALLRIAQLRGKIMAEVGGRAGAMLSINVGQEKVTELLNGQQVVIACLNTPLRTVVSGEESAVGAFQKRAQAAGFNCTSLAVSHAFHSPLMVPVAPALATHIARENFQPPQRTVISTVTGARLNSDIDLRLLLSKQVTSPVRFMEAMAVAGNEGVDLWIEAGPGQILCGLVGDLSDTPVAALDAGGASLQGLLQAIGACFVLGASVNHAELFAGRFTRSFELNWSPRFFVNPCELAPAPHSALTVDAPEDQKSERVENNSFADNLPSSKPRTEVVLETVRQLVAEWSELPYPTIKESDKLLNDLHLSSIIVSQIVMEASRRIGLPPPVMPTSYADATVGEIAQALCLLTSKDEIRQTEESLPAGVDSWIRTFTVELVERPLSRRAQTDMRGEWRIFAQPEYPLKNDLQGAFERLQVGRGIVVALPPDKSESHVGILLESAQAALKEEAGFKVVFVQHGGGGAAAFARTLFLEAQHLGICVVDVPLEHPNALEWIVAEALAAEGYTEAHYDADGQRREPILRPLLLQGNASKLLLTTDDVLVVTGGARGITAECVLALARESGARVALFGLSQPAADEEIKSNLERMAKAGVDFRYYSVDVTDAAAVRKAIRTVEADLGPVTGIIHGAAKNVPQLIKNLTEEAFLQTLSPKVQGARNLLAAINPDKLRLFVTFGSIIARTGLPGEAHYGFSNELLRHLTERWQAAHPHCRSLTVEFSIWSNVGMGARIGGVDALIRQGITPISPEQGVEVLRQLLSHAPPTTSVVVMGRFREMPTLKIERPELPFLRFLEKPRVYYPKLELIVDVELSAETDLYLGDHVFQGRKLLPAVIGMEAMAQVATALMGTVGPLTFEQVKFERPIIVNDDERVTIRIAALAGERNQVEVVLRSSETGFQIDHFSARCTIGNPQPAPGQDELPSPVLNNETHRVPLDPDSDLYGKILFHRGRFRRLREYRRLRATDCLAEIAPDGATSWFSRYLPGELVLGDPGARDAAIHAIQACIPQSSLLPVSVDRVMGGCSNGSSGRFVSARERAHHNGTFTYDLELINQEGRVEERWEGLSLRVVKGAEFAGPWVAGLLGPYVERRLKELIPGSAVSVVIDHDPDTERVLRSRRAIQQALGDQTSILRRNDGKPEVADGRSASVSHAGGLTLAVAGSGPLGCDIEPVKARSATVWRHLLGDERSSLVEIVERETGDERDAAATRVWSACECLKKAGAGTDAPLVFATSSPDGWLLFASGKFIIASNVFLLQTPEERLSLAVLVKDDNERL
jgi:enediyne polyketide synthase